MFWKRDTSSKKEMKIIKTIFFDEKLQKKCQESIKTYKVAFFTVNLPPITCDVTAQEKI